MHVCVWERESLMRFITYKHISTQESWNAPYIDLVNTVQEPYKVLSSWSDRRCHWGNCCLSHPGSNRGNFFNMLNFDTYSCCNSFLKNILISLLCFSPTMLRLLSKGCRPDSLPPLPMLSVLLLQKKDLRAFMQYAILTFIIASFFSYPNYLAYLQPPKFFHSPSIHPCAYYFFSV